MKALLGFQEKEFIINSNVNTYYINILEVNDKRFIKFRYSIKYEKMIKAIQILDENDNNQNFGCSFADNSIGVYLSNLKQRKSDMKELLSENQIISFTYDKNSQLLYGASQDALIKIWDLNEYKLIFITHQPNTINSTENYYVKVILDVNQQWKLIEMSDKNLNITNFQGNLKQNSNKIFQEIEGFEDPSNFNLYGHSKWIKSFHSFKKINNKEILLSSSKDRLIKSWDLQTMKEIESIKLHFMYIYAMLNIIIDNRDFIITGSGDRKIKIWDFETKQIKSTLLGHEAIILCLCYIEKLKHLISGSNDSTIRVWDLKTYENIKIIRLHHDCIRNVLFIENVNSLNHIDFLVSCSDDGTMGYW